VPLRRVYLATNILVLVLSGFLVVELGRLALVPPSDAVALDFPLRGEWFVGAGGRSALVNHHYIPIPAESNAIDLVQLGSNSQTHTGPSLSSYAAFGAPIFAPASGRIIDVRNDRPDEPIGQKGTLANDLVQNGTFNGGMTSWSTFATPIISAASSSRSSRKKSRNGSRVRHVDPANVGVFRGERIVRRQHVGRRERVEQRRLADVGKSDDSELEHDARILNA